MLLLSPDTEGYFNVGVTCAFLSVMLCLSRSQGISDLCTPTPTALCGAALQTDCNAVCVAGGVQYIPTQPDSESATGRRRFVAMTSDRAHHVTPDGSHGSEWSSLARLQVARRRPAVVSMDNSVICIGGSQGNGRYLNSVEMLYS